MKVDLRERVGKTKLWKKCRELAVQMARFPVFVEPNLKDHSTEKLKVNSKKNKRKPRDSRKKQILRGPEDSFWPDQFRLSILGDSWPKLVSIDLALHRWPTSPGLWSSPTANDNCFVRIENTSIRTIA